MNDLRLSLPNDPPTEEELERLEFFLEESEPNPGIPLEGIDGMLAAVACGPEPVEPSEWLTVIWNGRPPAFESDAQAEQILGTLVKIYADIERRLEAGDYGPLVTIWEDETSGEEFEDPEDWCRGFLTGMQLRGEKWSTRMKADPEFDALLEPIVDGADPSDELREAMEDTDTLHDLLDDICQTVSTIREYWQKQV